ncbi:TetR family transcriptional regulator [Jatrophihabitans sp. DSM 45814]
MIVLPRVNGAIGVERAAEIPGGQPRALSIDEIVEAALRLGLEHGFESLSMRPLARELGVSPMAIYHHVGNKDDLLVLLVDAVLAGIVVPPPDTGMWEERLRILDGRSSAVLATWRGIDAVMFGMRPTEHGWRLINAYIEIFLDAGFDERGAALAFSVIHSYGLGRAGMEQRLMRSNARGGREAPPASWPALAQLQPYWADLHKPDYRDFGINVIVAGLRLMLSAHVDRQEPNKGKHGTPPTARAAEVLPVRRRATVKSTTSATSTKGTSSKATSTSKTPRGA